MQNALQAGTVSPKSKVFASLSLKKRNATVEIISALFILLFVYTAVSKLSEIPNFQNVLSKSPLIGSMAPYIAWGLPILELLVAALLFIPKTRRWGLFSSLALMIGFTVYLGYMIYFTPNLPCSCGGVLSQMSWKQHLIFNTAFTLLALIGVLLSRKRSW